MDNTQANTPNDVGSAEQRSAQWWIGVCLMICGFATWVAVLALPHKPNNWVFGAAGFAFLVGGGWRIDRSTRAFRSRK